MAEENNIEVVQKKPKTTRIISVAIIINIAIIAGVIFVFMGKGAAAKSEPAIKESAEHAHGPGPLVEMPNFVVNVRSAEDAKYLKAAIVVELANETLREPFSKWQQILRNEVLVYLPSLDVEQTRTVKQKRAIERHIKDIINKRVGSEMVTGVYFTEFVTQ